MSGEFDRAQKRLGIRLPTSARAFYREPRVLKHLSPASLRDITEFTYLYPAHPPRYFPFFGISSGDVLGLYFPRGGDPLVAGFDHEQGNVVPLSKDAEGLFQDPDAFVFNVRSKPGHTFLTNEKVFQSLRPRPTGRAPELELLRPFAALYDPLKDLDPRLLGPLLKRFRSTRPPASFIRETFSDLKSVQDRKRWFALSARLNAEGFPMKAIQALENCFVLHAIYPYYGEPDKSDPGPEWKKVVEVYWHLEPLYRAHGDEFDRITNRHKLVIARKWAGRH